MTEIQGKSILVRVSARFELARVRVIGSQLYYYYYYKYFYYHYYYYFLMCTCEQHTYTSSEHFHLEELRRNHARPGQRKFLCPWRESNSRPSKSHHSRKTNRKIMAGILSSEPTFDRKILLRILDMFLPSKRLINSSQSLKRDRRPLPASKCLTALLTNMRILKIRSQQTIAFFAAVSHLNGPLRKQNFILTGSKGQGF